MKQLNEEIKTGQLRQVYLLYGEEAYLRRQYRDRLKAALTDGDAMNCHIFEGKDVRPAEIIDLAETMPFLAPRRVVIIENSGLFQHGGGELAEYVPAMAPTAYLVFAETDVDKRSRLFKAVREKGRAIEFPTQDETTLRRWISGLVTREKKRMSDRDVRYFLEKTGTDMANIRTELEKLFCYAADKETITDREIDVICTRRITNQIFDMIGAIADKNRSKALALYYDLLALREPPMRILFLIARQFHLLLLVKECRAQGYDNHTIAEKAGLRGFLVGKYLAQASHFDAATLREAVGACVDAEERVKTGRLDDRMSVELLILTYSG